jgi:hypothetical protein
MDANTISMKDSHLCKGLRSMIKASRTFYLEKGMGILADDKEWFAVMQETSEYAMPCQVRATFAVILQCHFSKCTVESV